MASQKFRFADLYRDNRAAVEKTLLSMWCGETKNESQKAYVAQLKGIIKQIFAPEGAVPLVQCMNSYENVHSVSNEEAEAVVGDLWKKSLPKDKYFAPYEHQYQAWNTLLNRKTDDNLLMSICVTTGTGSGKTECFMMPLVKDLLDNPAVGTVQAIFLYPLNALMEDQKARLETLLEGTDLTYAVYNGDMPEKLPNKNDPNYERIKRKVDDIKGVYVDENGETKERYKHAIATREELRKMPANILLTNPTMLEYILLRSKDASLINEEKHSLRWVAIDETHTYTGAGAAEMAMLLRRVLMAFDVKQSEVRFATSSATIGNATGEAKAELQEFISKMTGVETRQVEVIGGERQGVNTILDDEWKPYWLKLINENQDGYISLNDLFPGSETIEQKLAKLDMMCQKAEENELTDLRAKVHYFYRVPNRGLFVDITQHEDGSFKIFTENDPNAGHGDRAPYLELSRCKHCGEYVAVAEVNYTDSTYSPITMDDSDMFDLEDTEETHKKFLIFGMTDEEVKMGDNNSAFTVHGNQFRELTPGVPREHWQVIANMQCSCPYCGKKLTKKSKAEEENPDVVGLEEQDMKKLQKFRVAPDFVSRLIAPSTLNQMTVVEPNNGEAFMHQGQQYISFVDSRQGAAQSTMKQNLEEERLWVYSKIFHELSKRSLHGLSKEAAIQKAMSEVQSATTPEQMMAKMTALQNLQSADPAVVQAQLQKMSGTPYVSWNDIYELLAKDDYLEEYCQQFAERSETSTEYINGQLTEAVKKRYIQSMLVQYLSKRPLSAAAPETMGLFTSYYSKLEKALTDELPDEVKGFNSHLSDSNKISKKDWHDLMKIFLDYTVRSNESVYLKMSDHDPLDIFMCVRFATQKDRRRPINKPQIKSKSANMSRVVRLLANLLAEEKHIPVSNAISDYKPVLQGVIDAMWEALTDKYELITSSTHYDQKIGEHVKDKDQVIDDVHYPPYRLNLADLGFKLYNHVSLVDTNTSKENESRHVMCLRPIETNFKGYSPYLVGGVAQRLRAELQEEWSVYPFAYEKGIERKSQDEIESWAKENRKLLWNNDLWGENGVFANRLNTIHQFPDLFIQAEHTAQVDKMISRQVQKDFKAHEINILACSTTMEMGVDLGDLELVMMTSVPPQPANYKQRSGRSGRRGQTRSAAVTLCGSDAIGIRTLFKPMESLIMRSVANPTVDLESAQVIQRHVNSFLVKEFGVFNMGEHGGSIMQKTIDYYTNFKIEHEGHNVVIRKKVGNAPVGPADGLGEEDGTPYASFNSQCSEPIGKELRKKLKKLLHDTIFAGRYEYVIQQARAANEACYSKLERRLSDLAIGYTEAKSEKQRNFFMMKYIEPMASQLLSYWATHQFTPNANMPVNVIEFDINSSKEDHYSTMTSSNPSYPLRTALAQYAPGNPIARDGMVRIVRGIRYTGFFRPLVTFKKLYHSKDQVVIDNKEEIGHLEVWPVSRTTDLELLQPAEFIPDMNESATRILDKNEYTRVSAQLIGTEEWAQDRTEPHLFDARSSRETGEARILYYNEGIGYGYCHCTKCGRTILEQWAAASAGNPELLPPEMNEIQPNDTEKPKFHFSLIKKKNKAQVCVGCSNPEYIHRNVVLGDTIPTDFTEIRIRHLNEDWISMRDESNQNLLITLGVLFAQALAEVLNVERGDIDFAITQNGHICIFDTNPGGSGYSNQLVAMDLLKEVVNKSLDYILLAEKANSKDVLVDRQTLHLLNYIDLEKAKSWIEEELNAQESLPAAIQAHFPDAIETSLAKMEKAFALSQRESVLFVDNDYSEWNYDGAYHGWKGHFFPYFVNRGQQTSLCVMESTDSPIGEPNMNMLRSMEGWLQEIVIMKNPYAAAGLYPLAYIDGRLYFTNNPEHRSLNDRWAGGTMYCARVSNLAEDADPVDTKVEDSKTVIFKLTDGDKKNITTRELGNIIYDKGKRIIDQFVAHCQANKGGTLRVTYQDEHLKSIVGMVLTIQTIESFIKKIGVGFDLEYKVERYDTENGKADSVTANQPNSSKRDQWLESITNSWLDEIEHDYDIVGELEPIMSAPKRSLTHWRVLSFEYEGKKLSIYPDGGLVNGWFIDHQPDGTRYDTQNITHDAEISLYRIQDLKYDVTIDD